MERLPVRGILSDPIDGPRRGLPDPRRIQATPGLVVTHLGSRLRGTVIRVEGDAVVIRAPNTALERLFRLYPGAFSYQGETVTLVRPLPQVAAGGALTASGSLAVPRAKTRVARAGRILVEGLHDAELVEKIWGDDLRIEGVVVERLDGIDVLEEVIRSLNPGPGARLGVLVDHLLPQTKESRIAEACSGPYVRVAGTPYVDVWQAVRPCVVGIEAWPVVPRGRPWKEGICEALGEPSPGRLWKRLLGKVRTYADLEPSLVGAVESLIDFVTT